MLHFLSHQHFRDLSVCLPTLSPRLTPGNCLQQRVTVSLTPGTWKVPLQRLTEKPGRKNQETQTYVSTLALWDKQHACLESSPGLAENPRAVETERGRDKALWH